MSRLVPATRPWTLEDVRLLDHSFALDPAADISAIYTRQAGFRCEIRLDFLDLPETPQYNFSITLKERVIKFKDDLPLPQAAKFEYDAVTDTILVSLRDCSPVPGVPLVVTTAAERLATTFGAQPALEPLRLQFVFSNAFSPVATPIQALRRWDGAHAGPRGERHGLHGLLEAAEKQHVPLTVLGLNNPVVLSAIEAVQGTEQIHRMEQAGWLNLSDGEIGPQVFTQSELDHAGLSLETRQALLQATGALTLGGDLQRSTWGTYEYADPALAWLKARPYFVIVQASGVGAAAAQALPASPITASAEEMKAMLSNSDPQLAANYADLVFALEAAATWAEHPAPLAECQKRCVLATDRFYAVLDPLGGRLVFLFAGKNQIVGPTAQFFIGFSDRSQWDFSKGEGADPAQVMGAFADTDDAFRPYTATITGTVLRFVATDGREKTYQLTENGLEATLSGPVETKIPLVVAPQTRFESGWAEKYHLEREVNGVSFGVAGGPLVRIKVTGGQVLAADSFLEALPYLALPEDPNLETPPGFYLPFPMALVSISGPKGVAVQLELP